MSGTLTLIKQLKRKEASMKHYQKHFSCGVCKREFIVDILSIGTAHQFVQTITCLECAEKVGGKIMKEDEQEKLNSEKVE